MYFLVCLGKNACCWFELSRDDRSSCPFLDRIPRGVWGSLEAQKKKGGDESSTLVSRGGHQNIAAPCHQTGRRDACRLCSAEMGSCPARCSDTLLVIDTLAARQRPVWGSRLRLAVAGSRDQPGDNLESTFSTLRECLAACSRLDFMILALSLLSPALIA